MVLVIAHNININKHEARLKRSSCMLTCDNSGQEEVL